MQVEDQQLMDYKGDYEVFLENNEEEAEKIAAIEDARREVEKSQIKAKSKVRHAGIMLVHTRSFMWCTDVQGRESKGEKGQSQAIRQQGCKKEHKKRQALELTW